MDDRSVEGMRPLDSLDKERKKPQPLHYRLFPNTISRKREVERKIQKSIFFYFIYDLFPCQLKNPWKLLL